jgi:PAS domain S-box-containing protein
VSAIDPAAAFLRTAGPFPEAMLLVEAGGRLRAANPEAVRLLGRSAATLAGVRLHDLAGDEAAQVDALLKMAARTRSLVPGALRLQGDDGTELACRCEGALYQPAQGGEPSLVMLRLSPREQASNRFIALSQRVEALTHEIARRRRVEAELHDERERLRVTLASIGDAVIVTDVAGCVTFMNGVAEALTGWSTADALGRPIDEVFVIVNHDTGLAVESPVAKVLREGIIVGLANHTVLLPRGGGPALPIDDSGAPVRDDHGRLVGVVMVFHDVSERASLERALRLKATELMATDRRKDEFLAMLSHELRNPLAPLNNGVHLLRGLVGSEPKAARITGMMERQLRHLTTLVDDLLDVSRITRGVISLQPSRVVLAEALQLAVELARPMIDEQRHALQVDLPPASLCVEGDANRLAQVFANLLSNAAKYTPAGGEVRLRWCEAEGGIRVAVSDNGVGLGAALIDRVFELFQQGERSLARSQGGLGVGLTIARALVEMHGGRISAHSAGEGCGSEFVVWLPLALAASGPASGARLPALPTDAPQRRVLVVDDNLDAALSLAVLIELWGHAVRVAADGEQALELFPALQPDVVLLDIGLPGMDGYQTAGELRRLAGGAPVTIVAVTGYGRDEDRQLAAEAGFDLHLVKPLDLERLQDLLARSLASTGDAATPVN